MQWQYTDCGSNVQGTIAMDPKGGSSATWQAIFLSNSRQPISKVWVDGQPLTRDYYNYWVYQGALSRGRHTLTIQGANQAIINATITNLSAHTTLGVQFAV